MSAPGDPQPDSGGGPAPAEDQWTEDAPRSDGASAGPPVCDVCGAPMYERHCRIICPRCGYQRDCSDP